MTKQQPLNLTFRLAEATEAATLAEVNRLAFASHTPLIAPEFQADWLANLDNRTPLFEELLQVGSTAFVAETIDSEGITHIIATAILVPKNNPTPRFPEYGTWASIRWVSVLPDYSGQGIGRLIFEKCLAYARETGEEAVLLHTSNIMNAARHIYESLGFRILREETTPFFGLKYWLFKLDFTSPHV